MGNVKIKQLLLYPVSHDASVLHDLCGMRDDDFCGIYHSTIENSANITGFFLLSFNGIPTFAPPPGHMPPRHFPPPPDTYPLEKSIEQRLGLNNMTLCQ